jgi:hypothetical protein
MLPSQLSAEQFHGYPPKARQLAVQNVGLLRQLPLSFVPFLLKEIILYDWKFPAEQWELDKQLSYLEGLPDDGRQAEMARFARLQLAARLEAFDWVNSPGQFLELLSAHLWATHQTDEFREASEQYVHKFYAALARPRLPAPRLGIVALGRGASANRYSLFRKLRRSGVYFTNVNPVNGLEAIVAAVGARAVNYPQPYGHWSIQGGARMAAPGVTCVSYEEMTPIRTALTEKMRAAYESPAFSPEDLRTVLARIEPGSLGMAGAGRDKTLDRFQLSLLTEGSGTQIYSTTFVQWAAREALRRAQPLTLFTRYAPRQKERPMNELLTGTGRAVSTDPEGSLIDADMGAYYTWLNQQRLPGAEESRFLVWFEGHGEALAVGPHLKGNTSDQRAIHMADLLETVTKEPRA